MHCSKKTADDHEHLVNTNQNWKRNVKTRIGLRYVWDMLNLKCQPRPCISCKKKTPKQNKINKVFFCLNKKNKVWPLLTLNRLVYIEHNLKIVPDNKLGGKNWSSLSWHQCKVSVAFQKGKKKYLYFKRFNRVSNEYSVMKSTAETCFTFLLLQLMLKD